MGLAFMQGKRSRLEKGPLTPLALLVMLFCRDADPEEWAPFVPRMGTRVLQRRDNDKGMSSR